MSAPEPSVGRRFTRRLALRVGGVLCLGAAAILAVAAAWNISLQRDHMTSVLTASAVRSANMVRHATRDAMLMNRRDGLQEIMRHLDEQPDIAHARIFDKSGVVRYSTAPSEVGTLVDTHDEQCVVCHEEGWTTDVLSPEQRVRQFRRDGHGVLAVTTPIPNEPACSSGPCHVHSPDRLVLGVLDVQLPLDKVEAQIAASESQMALGLGFTTLALVGLSVLVIWRVVIAPVRRLTDVTREVAKGDLSARAPVTSRHEIGELTATWNSTVAQLADTRETLDELVQTLEDRVDAKTAELSAAHDQMLQVEKMASLGKLAAVVAHEVNNPLAGIATYARLLRKRHSRQVEGDDDETSRILQLMESEAGRCGEIVRNLLLFSRTPGRLFAEADLSVLLGRCVLLFHHQADLQEVTVELAIAEDLPTIICDASQVQQLVLALSMNAIEAMPEGGSLRIAASPVEDHVTITVEDTGGGIDETELPHVFEPFYTTKPEGKGVGLGLAVVYGIARRHGGSVTASSQRGKGTRFVVRLPLEPPPETADAPPLLEGVIT